MKKRLLLLSFVEGATVMVAELCGARLLSPVFGSSLFVWAAVMGVTLAALAAGYFFGGYLSHKTEQQKSRLFWVLNLAALSNMAMPALSYYLIPRISYLPFTPGVLISTCLLLFAPIFLLGASSPLFIALQTSGPNTSGRVSGTVYAVSTAGGIFSTFVCGFYAIPEFGLTYSLLGAGLTLFVLTCLVLKVLRFDAFLTVLGLLYFNIRVVRTENTGLYNSQGILGNIRVTDLPKHHTRILTVNDIVQSEMSLDNRKSVSEYMRLLDTLIPASLRGERALVLGLGAGLSANMLQEKGYSTEGVEFDSRIIDIAKNYFFLNSKVVACCADARYVLNTLSKDYKIIVVDVFKAEEQPSHVITLESLDHLKKKISPDAQLFINWHGYSSGPNSTGTWIVYNTLRQAGYSVKMTALHADQAHRNIVIVASPKALPKLPYELNEEQNSIPLVNTDDKPLLEKYTASANKAWRLSYLRYYQQTR